MKKKNFLDSVDVPVPCDKSWDEMIGNNVSRFCKHCEKDIYNISAMTRHEAKKLLFQSKEKVCIRMEREPNGKIKTLKKQLHQITRQMPLATGVLTASLILAGTTNAQETKVETSKITITQIADKNSKTTISGTITDSNSAIVPGIKIILRNTKDNSSLFTTSNAEGFYEFKDVESSNYEIEIAEQSGFEKFIYKNLLVENNKKMEIKLVLGNQKTTDCFTQNNIPVTTETPQIDDKVTYQQIQDLPLSSDRKSFVLGLFPGVKEKTKIKTSQISFTILDQNNAVIVNAKIILKNGKLKKEYKISTDIEGVAKFDDIPIGDYRVEVSANLFQKYKGKIKIKEAVENEIKVNLKTSNEVVGVFISKP